MRCGPCRALDKKKAPYSALQCVIRGVSFILRARRSYDMIRDKIMSAPIARRSHGIIKELCICPGNQGDVTQM